MRHNALIKHPELLLKARSIDESYEGVDDVDFMPMTASAMETSGAETTKHRSLEKLSLNSLRTAGSLTCSATSGNRSEAR